MKAQEGQTLDWIPWTKNVIGPGGMVKYRLWTVKLQAYPKPISDISQVYPQHISGNSDSTR